MIVLKKVFAVILCLVISVAALPAFAQDAGGFEPSEYNEAVSLLKDLKILDGSAYADYNASLQMTRGEFAALSVQIMGMEKEALAASYQQRFGDVAEDNVYAKHINFAVQSGLFNGVSDTEFEPDAPVYISQAVKVAVNMIGYKDFAESKGGYPSGYMVAAAQARILDNVILTAETPSLRGNIIVLMYNTLFADIMKVDGFQQDGYNYTVQEDINILSEYHDVYEDEGIVTANWEYSITNTVEDDHYVVINGKRFYTQSPLAVGVVGKNVKYYYKENGRQYTLLTLREENNKVMVIKANDDYSLDFAKGIYTLKTAEKDYTLKIGNEYDLVYNASLVDGGTKVDFERYLTPLTGTITLIDNDEDNIYEVIIVDESKIVLFGSYDAYSETIFDKLDRNYDLCLKEYDPMTIEDTAGAIVEPEKLSEDNVLMVYEDVNGKSAKIIVCLNVVNGKINELKDTDSVYIGSAVYDFSKNARISNELVLGKSYQLYLDKYNEIVYYKLQSFGQTAYILKTGRVGTGIDSGNSAELLTASGIKSVYKFADHVKVKTISRDYSCTNDNVDEKLMDLANGMYSNGCNQYARLFVQYDLNLDKEISSITLPYVIQTKDEFDNPPSNYSFFKLDYLITGGAAIGSTLSYTPSNKSAGLWMIFDSSCSIYYVPTFDNAEYKVENLAVNSIDSLVRDDNVYFTNNFTGANNQLEAYSTDNEVRLVNDLVWVSEKGVATDVKNSYSNNCLVTKVSQVLSPDGDTLWKLSILENKQEKSITTDKYEVLQATSFKQTKLDGITPTVSEGKANIKAGDVIKYALNSDGYVSEIALMYDSENANICYLSNNYTKYGAQYRYTSGEIKDFYSGYGVFSLHESDWSAYVEESHLLNSYARIYVYDLDENEGRIGTKADLSIGDKIFVCDNYRDPREMVVYKGGRD